MFKRTILGLAVAALTLPGALMAQESATIVLRSGERVSGQLLDHGGVGFTIRVNGQERQIPTNDVSVVDFTGGTMSAADWQKVTGGTHVIWLRNGQTVTGQFYDIGGTTPLRITVKTETGDRDFTSSEVARIALAQPNSGASPTTGAAVPEGAGVAVPGNQQWTPTGLTVRKGEVLRFTSTGEVQFTPNAEDIAQPAGSKAQKHVSGAPLPQNFAGALIARVGNGEPFPIGDQTTVTMPAAGQLFLGINDDNVSDNQGGFRVNVQRTTRR